MVPLHCLGIFAVLREPLDFHFKVAITITKLYKFRWLAKM